MSDVSREVIIRKATTGDALQIGRLIYRSHTMSFPAFASNKWVASRELNEYESKTMDNLSNAHPASATYIAEINDQIVGTVRVTPIDDDHFDAMLAGMHVDPDSTDSGIGSVLMHHALAFIATQGFAAVQLGVIAGNAGARRFYERYGWESHEEIPVGVEGVPVVIYRLAKRPQLTH